MSKSGLKPLVRECGFTESMVYGDAEVDRKGDLPTAIFAATIPQRLERWRNERRGLNVPETCVRWRWKYSLWRHVARALTTVSWSRAMGQRPQSVVGVD